MKINKVLSLKVFAGLLLTLSLASCSKSNGTSKATGWKINDNKGGFQYNAKYKKQATPPGMIAIEGGSFTMGKVADDIMHDWNNSPTQQHVQSFYMDETEVTNMMYAEYLFWLKSVFPPSDESYMHIYEGALPDTLVWRNRLGYNETMTNNYLRHPAYGQYPVVGVNWLQAEEFSKWRTDRVNERLLEESGYLKRDSKITEDRDGQSFNTEAYLNSPSSVFGGDQDVVLRKERGRGNEGEGRNVYAQRTTGILLPEYRLPTEAEWEYAAMAMNGIREYNLYKGKKKYPWNGQYTRSNKRANRGQQLANFKQGRGDYGGIAGWPDDGADITNQVKSYPPNDFGLYDMAGNVAEWVADVYRPIVDDEANDFNYYRGNMFMKNAINPDGTIQIVSKENIVYDTLSNGKIMARNFPGKVAQVAVDDNETYLRYNFNKSDNRDYRDGDLASTRNYRNQESESNQPRMYDSPIHSISVDSLNRMVKEIDRTTKRTTLVNNDARVYKGGSWRDRAYWLDPATRRYYPQDMATDYIGFRCAMSKVGPKENKRKVRG
ncbi:gliding motility lipoprotein GldJ [Flavobacterium agricola]|uniref:Gliding motility lipoprotein GldJ n=1 Tax=Flavobacterium agricola TaxID=2870839 RepID=A0ABY6LZ57_9FLAO|nr:gliding motility lipoprotein GldJ [Flavobacterium agricola]UYW01471.1 gliding motility lipoprotein GldJ [Flavobacterium agricola]